MKYIFILTLYFLGCTTANAQYHPKDYFEFKDKKELVFFDDFNSDKTEWHMLPEDSDDTTNVCTINTDGINYGNGIYYVYNNCKEEVGIEAAIEVDYTRNFEIILVAKVLYDDNDDTSVHNGYLEWNSNEQTGKFNILFFSGFFNEFHTHLSFDSTKNNCEGLRKRLKPARNTYNQFVRYTIRKYGDKYYVFVNGMLKGVFPYTKLNGSNIALGARMDSKVEFDHLSIYYLP